jgi:uncharacterized membrane protein/3-hydroxymyristoyl/3-hydroxydecanoyl-(acyl carrier protein) dehydratase
MKGRAGAAVTFLLSLAVVVMVFLLPPYWLALPLLGMAGGLFVSRKSSSWSDLLAPVLMAALSAFVFISDSRQAAMTYPIVVNLGLLMYFGGSLRGGPTAIERLARLEQPELPAEGVRYTRILTKVWCGFFFLNGSFAAFTVWWGDARLWALYNGGVSYLLIGLLVFGERLGRPYLSRVLLGGSSAETAALANRLLGAARTDEAMVCVIGDRVVALGQFREDVLAKARAVAASSVQEWIMDAAEGYPFAVDLLAVCLSGRHAVVPQNHQPATLASLRMRHPEAVACGEVVAHAGAASAWQPADGGRISFHTSGSSGEPKCVTCAFVALVGEAETMEAAFGGQLGAAQVIGTVPHHFIYGTIFRIIWPLWSGRVFRCDPLGDGYAVLACLRRGGDFILVSSPSLLERVPAEDIPDLAPLKAIFSSGSLLRSEVALRWGSPVEIYGSTETGGVAWRRQQKGGEAWESLPGVVVSAGVDARLRVVSPFVAPGGELTADAVRIGSDGRFELLGRVDRIAKVEGRRVSLPELEAIIESHPAVRRAVIFQPEGHARLAAIVVPRGELPMVDYIALAAELRAALLVRHDAVVVPRRWKLLPRLPADARGKATQATLRAIFDPPSKGFPAEAGWPQLLAHQSLEDGVRLTLKVPPELPIFAGHFPGLPILPGVTLIDWAALIAETYLGVSAEFTVVDNLKFNAAVYPMETLELTLTRCPDGVRFRYDHDGKLKASGALLRQSVLHV